MKKLLIIPILFVFSSVLAQTKQKDIQQLFTILQFNTTTQKGVDKLIDLYKKQKPTVPESTWEDIKGSIDYNSFIDRAASIFNTNYTPA